MPPHLQAMAAVIGALMIFSGLLLLGCRIVRWLRLPTDLPEGPRFEPPPPPAQEPGEPAAAIARATAQNARYQAGQAARQAAHKAMELAEVAATLGPLDDAALTQAGSADPAALRARTREAEALAATDAEAAWQAFAAADGRATGEAAARVAQLHREIAELIAPLTIADPRRRRITRMLILLILAITLFALSLLLRGNR